MLKEQIRSLACLDGEVLLYLSTFLATKRWIGKYHIHSVFLLNISKVLSKGVGVHDVWRFYPMQNHVHDANHIGKTLLLFAIERVGLQCLVFSSIEFLAVAHEVVCFAKESSTTHSAVVDSFANLGIHHLYDAFDQWARSVIFASVASSIAHVLDFVFVQAAEFVLVCVAQELEFINFVHYVTQSITTLHLVSQLAKYLPNLVINGARIISRQFEV